MTLAELRDWLTTLAEAEAVVPAANVLARLPAEGALPASDLTADQVAEVVDRTPACIRGWCRDGKLPGAYRMGEGSREWRIPREALDNLKAGQRRAATVRRTRGLSSWRDELKAAG